MSSALKNKKFNLKQSEYLLDCDLINKYCLKSLYKKPKVKKISIHFLLESFSSVYTLDSNIQVKSVLLFYALFSLTSYINFKKIRLKKTFKNSTEAKFSLKVILSDKESINLFLFQLLVENSGRIELEDIKLFRKSPTFGSMLENTQHTIWLPAKTLFDVDDFFSKTIKDIDLKSFDLKLNLGVKTCYNFNDKEKLIKNISFFWINK